MTRGLAQLDVRLNFALVPVKKFKRSCRCICRKYNAVKKRPGTCIDAHLSTVSVFAEEIETEPQDTASSRFQSRLECGRVEAERLDCPAASNQVDYRYNERNYEQQVDQTAGNMKSPAKKPEDNKDRENCPKHRFPLKIKRRTLTAIEWEAAS
jgi:hypothetical protein